MIWRGGFEDAGLIWGVGGEWGLGACGEGSAVIKDDGGGSELYVDVTKEILWTYRSSAADALNG